MNTELYIEGTEIELSGDTAIPLTLSVSDIAEPEKRRNAFSKTITVPGTPHNNAVFGQAYHLNKAIIDGLPNVGTTFNRKKLANFVLLQDGTNLLSGTAQLTEARIRNGTPEYKLVLFSELTNLFNSIGADKLTDLSGSELEHDYTLENITGSWAGTEPYVYPLIDYGFVNTRMQSTTMQNLKPAVFAHWYWDQIFDEAGFTYSGSFMESDLWKSMIIPYNKAELERLFDFSDVVLTNSPQTYTTELTYNPFDLVLEDDEGYYDPATSVYTAPMDAEYDFRWFANLEVRFQPYELEPETLEEPEVELQNEEVNIKIRLIKNGSTYEEIIKTIPAGTYLDESQGWAFNLLITDIDITDQFSQVELVAGDEIRIEVEHDYFTSAAEPFIDYNTGINYSGEIRIRWIDNISFVQFGQQQIEGSTLRSRQFIPTDFSQRDFLTGILRLFNLYLVPDPDVPKKLLVKTRDEFYSEGGTRDWSELLAESEWITNQNIPRTVYKELHYKYKRDDDDWYLELYKSRWGKEYGERVIDTGYEFSREVKDVLDLPFGTAVPIGYRRGTQPGEFAVEVDEAHPDIINVQGLRGITPLYNIEPTALPEFQRAYIGRRIRLGGEIYTITDTVSPWRMRLDRNVPQIGSTPPAYLVFNQPFVYLGGGDDKVVPAIVESNDNGRTFQPFDGEYRILAYNGALPAESWTIQQTPIYTEGRLVYLFNTEITKSITITEYPFTSHVLGTPTAPTYDLLFDKPDQVFWAVVGVDFMVDELGNFIVDENDNIIKG